MRVFLNIIFLFFSVMAILSCGEKRPASVKVWFMVGDSVIDNEILSKAIDKVCDADTANTAADYAVRRFYRDNHILCWLTRDGLSSQIDSLLAYIERSDETGIPSRFFYVKEIKADLRRLYRLDFSDCNVHTLISRLDYRLTKAFVRYSAWQRHGLVNPCEVLNHLDNPKYDSTKTVFLTLYDIPTEIADTLDLSSLAKLAGTRFVSSVLSAAEPKTQLYRLLKNRLATSEGEERLRVLINMERCRWRHPSVLGEDEKYVVVNIPSYMLNAVSPDTVVEMRIVCGSPETKSPLIHSEIKRMDVNPRWNVPYSVMKYEMARHAGDSGYFYRNRYHIINSKTGAPMNPSLVTAGMLKSGKLRVYQEGGRGNSLGRIIFRFDNKHDIFLHDTSSPGAFSREDRRISHGCIRVQQPYQLAEFLLGDINGERNRMLDKLRYSMEYQGALEAPARRAADGDEASMGPDPKMLIRSLNVNPRVPIYITYFTLFNLPDSTLHSYPDVYGYDEALAPYVCF